MPRANSAVPIVALALLAGSACGRKYVIGARGAEARQAYEIREDMVRDRRTGLEWQRLWPRQAFAWSEAKSYCQALTLGGEDDWRLPTGSELSSLHTQDARGEQAAIDPTSFPRTPPVGFWSSAESELEYKKKRLRPGDRLEPFSRRRVSSDPEVIVTSQARCQSHGWESEGKYAWAVEFGRSDYRHAPRCTKTSRLLVRCVRGEGKVRVVVCRNWRWADLRRPRLRPIRSWTACTNGLPLGLTRRGHHPLSLRPRRVPKPGAAPAASFVSSLSADSA